MSTSDRPVKRSLTLQGHRTSVSLEAAFWAEFRRLAEAEGKSINRLAAEIDAARTPPGSLASAIRVYVLGALKAGNPTPPDATDGRTAPRAILRR